MSIFDKFLLTTFPTLQENRANPTVVKFISEKVGHLDFSLQNSHSNLH